MNKIKLYIEDAYQELVHKVTWPTWSEAQNSAVIVMIASLIIALIVLGMDSGFRFIMENLYKLAN
ncbi:MAG: preprotein translocase subunit SecE [Bacteroidia bacterium]|nr:preprotein translocase subunit SecE [Bacteroidia bacterium]MCZ2247496.1 preprotein translocase subunit SecE [Bacteroidia bacterium]